MNRLSSEFERLYLGEAPAGTAAPDATRTFVFELKRPVDWAVLSRVWRGVQTELGLPSPAIAVSGEGLQLWFSLEAPVAVARARSFLVELEERWLADVAPRQVDVQVPAMGRPPPRVPALKEDGERWSAFVAPDLASMFTGTPWLDIEPGEEGQASLLRGLRSIPSADFETAERQLAEDAERAAAPAASPSPPASPLVSPLVSPSSDAPRTESDPRKFLASVMNDPLVALALRIEAAKALLT